MNRLAAALILGMSAVTHAVIIESNIKLTGPTPENLDEYGDALDIDGTTMIVTSTGRGDPVPDGGAAYILDAFSGYPFASYFPQPGEGVNYGRAVAISGPYAVVGGASRVSVFISMDAQILNAFTGEPIAELARPIGRGFGQDVAVHGNTALISIPYDQWDAWPGDESGQVAVYNARTGELLNTLRPESGQDDEAFGAAVALHGGTALIGAPRRDILGAYDSGVAYIVDITSGEQLHRLEPPDAFERRRAGTAVAMCGALGVVGAPGHTSVTHQVGAAYVYDLITGELISTLIPGDGGPGDRFGVSVDISGRLVIVGAHRHDLTAGQTGAAYVFDAWTGQQLAKLIPADPGQGEIFGTSVAIDGTRAIVGCPGDSGVGLHPGIAQGAAYLFNLHELADICRGDLSDDGRVDIADLNIVLDHWNETPGAYMNGDVDGDGNVNAADLNAILAAWGACQ